MTSMLC